MVALLVRLLCCKLNFILSLCSLVPPPRQHQATPSLLYGPFSFNAAVFFIYMYLSLSSLSLSRTCRLIPSHSFCRSLSSLPAVGGSQPNVKRGNLVVSVAFAAFTPTVCPTQKVKKILQWWDCDMQADPPPPSRHLDPAHCRDGAPCPGEMWFDGLQNQKMPRNLL